MHTLQHSALYIEYNEMFSDISVAEAASGIFTLIPSSFLIEK